ncbi:hypothetical protein EMIT0111MI5_190003 [Burkholderia sp. IT-111MI5]
MNRVQRIGGNMRCFGREKTNATRSCRVAFVCLASRIACRQFALPTPSFCSLVGSIGFEPTTPTMSRWCSNQLSYEPKKPRIIETVFAEHKPRRENFLNREACGLAGCCACLMSGVTAKRVGAARLSTRPSG